MACAVEPDIPVNSRLAVIIAAILIAILPLVGRAEDQGLVIVADRHSPVGNLTWREVRHLYLGVAKVTEHGAIHPLINAADPELQEIFLQKVLFISRNAYRRLLARHLVTRRVSGPEQIDDLRKLIARLHADPNAISYIWLSDLPTDASLKPILVLHRESP